MTPSERAVIDAARAWADEREQSLLPDGDLLDPCEITLYRAVRALPRPLSEQLAELRVGAVVETDELRWRVFVNCPGHEVLLCRPFSDSKTLREAGKVDVVPYACIRRIISNPEASNG